MKVFILPLFLVLASCVAMPPASEVDVPEARVALSWETKPERAAWSDSLVSRMDSDWSTFDAAKDIGTFCPKYGKLSKPPPNEKLKLIKKGGA